MKHDYQSRVVQMADALHRDCVLMADARAAIDAPIDPGQDPWRGDLHSAARHYGQAHDLVRRIWPKLDKAR
jgi:mannose/cellobiose epimerase-like protein (N-acyl-D-glucosamine 2-epimerase family)